MKLVKLTATLSIILLLSGCGGNPVIPVSDLTPNKSRYPARIVEQGDSLYTIAWEFGLDYREVALWNRLRPPYHVTPGQKIRLGPAKVSNGIDIVGIEGSPIVAAAPGRIVYAGSGLRGYGLLLILKHDEHFLSAYAHNSLLLVDEGDSVRAEQVIAHMGSTDAEAVRLHFEIRLDGKPVDPLIYLPTRQ